MNDIYVEPKEYFTEEMLRILEGKDKVPEENSTPQEINEEQNQKNKKE